MQMGWRPKRDPDKKKAGPKGGGEWITMR